MMRGMTLLMRTGGGHGACGMVCLVCVRIDVAVLHSCCGKRLGECPCCIFQNVVLQFGTELLEDPAFHKLTDVSMQLLSA
jgi:hypothetical protein